MGILAVCGGLIRAEHGEPLLPQEITDLTGITDAQRIEFGRDAIDVFCETGGMASVHQAEYLVAHNAEFDRGFINATASKFILADKVRPLTTLPWIDTLTDLPLDYEPDSLSLQSLLADHRIINFVPHRAIFDAVATAALVLEYPIAKVVERAMAPTILLKANVTFDQNPIAKARRFFWDPPTKRWLKRVKEMDLPRESRKWKAAAERLTADTGVDYTRVTFAAVPR